MHKCRHRKLFRRCSILSDSKEQSSKHLKLLSICLVQLENGRETKIDLTSVQNVSEFEFSFKGILECRVRPSQLFRFPVIRKRQQTPLATVSGVCVRECVRVRECSREHSAMQSAKELESAFAGVKVRWLLLEDPFSYLCSLSISCLCRCLLSSIVSKIC